MSDTNPNGVVSPLDSATKRLLRSALAGIDNDADSGSTFERLLNARDEADFIRTAHSISPNEVDINGNTVGHHAAAKGYIAAYEDFMAPLAKRDRETLAQSCNCNGDTPGAIAIKQGQTQFVHGAIAKHLHLDWISVIETCFCKLPESRDMLYAILIGNYNYSLYDYSERGKRNYLNKLALYLASSTPGTNDVIEWIVARWERGYGSPFDSWRDRGSDRSPIDAAIVTSNLDALKKLIDLGALEDGLIDPRHLDIAIRLSHNDSLSLLLRHGTIRHSSYKYRPGPLYSAYEMKNWHAFRVLVTEGHLGVDAEDVSNGMGYLHLAVFDDLFDFAEVLLAVGADPHRPRHHAFSGVTPLGAVVSSSRSSYARQRFLHIFKEAGAEISGPACIDKNTGRTQSTASALISGFDDPETLVCLHALGVDLNQLNSNRESLIHVTVRMKRFESFKKLIELGVDLAVKDLKGKSAVDLIINNAEYVQFRQHLESLI